MKGFFWFVLGIVAATLCFLVALLEHKKEGANIIVEAEIPATFREIKNLNAGGCGFFALKLYRVLDKKKYSLAYIGKWNHVFVYENATGYLIDSNGFHNFLFMQLSFNGNDNKLSFITEERLENELKDWSRWNPKFNRNDTTLINNYIKLLLR